MRPGDEVIYLARPDWGVGTIEHPEPGGMLKVRFHAACIEDSFHPHELETLAAWLAREPITA